MQEEELGKPFGQTALSLSDVKQLINALGRSPEAIMQHIVQFHGEIVVVPPATVFCTLNLADCLHLDWQLYDLRNWGLYFESYSMHDAKYFGEENKEDCMLAGAALLNCVRRLGTRYLQLAQMIQ